MYPAKSADQLSHLLEGVLEEGNVESLCLKSGEQVARVHLPDLLNYGVIPIHSPVLLNLLPDLEVSSLF